MKPCEDCSKAAKSQPEKRCLPCRSAVGRKHVLRENRKRERNKCCLGCKFDRVRMVISMGKIFADFNVEQFWEPSEYAQKEYVGVPLGISLYYLITILYCAVREGAAVEHHR